MNRSSLLGNKWSCECGATHEVPVKKAVIGPGAIAKTPEVLRELGIKGRVFLLCDETTYDVAGREVEKLLRGEGCVPVRRILHGRPHADDATADDCASSCPADLSAVVSVGSGTITDLSKWTAFRRAIPQIAVATAPSMNGYASGIVALTRGGLKTTDAVRPPVAVIADIDILKAAPMEMICAGLGDVLSKPVCNADWKLSSIMRGEHFCIRPFEMIKDLEGLYVKDPGLIKSRDPKIISALAEALVYSGISMVIAGSSSPASGGEHLISHYLDMRAGACGRLPDFHGAQVGVASIATARLYERLMNLSAKDLNRNALGTIFGRYEEISGEIDLRFRQKKISRANSEKEAALIIGRWEEIKKAVSPFLMPSSKLRATLDSAGAKVHYAQLGVSPGQFREALLHSMCIRNRYTVLDLVFSLGELEGWAEEIVKHEAGIMKHEA